MWSPTSAEHVFCAHSNGCVASLTTTLPPAPAVALIATVVTAKVAVSVSLVAAAKEGRSIPQGWALVDDGVRLPGARREALLVAAQAPHGFEVSDAMLKSLQAA